MWLLNIASTAWMSRLLRVLPSCINNVVPFQPLYFETNWYETVIQLKIKHNAANL